LITNIRHIRRFRM